MKTVEIKQRLAEDILDQLEGAQQDNYVQSTENVINDLKQALRIPVVSQRSELLIDFLLHLNNKGLINNHDFDYEKEAKKYAKKLINCG